MTETLAPVFRTFARTECSGGYAPLYERLSLAVAADDELQRLAAEAREGQQPPNLLFAAVRRVLMDHPSDPLAAFHPDIGGRSRASGADPVAPFRAFCAAHHDRIIALLHTRLVQTNEPGRCAFLLPAVLAAERAAGRPVSLIDAGTSAGFTLCLDRYGYDYGDGIIRGDAESPLVLRTEIRGDTRPPLPPPMPGIVWRAGIDLNPLDPRNADDVAWLRALIWPERPARLEQLERALGVVRAVAPDIRRGDIFDLLPDLVRAAPVSATPAIVTSFVLAHFTETKRAAFAALLETLSKERPLFWLRTDRTGPDSPSAVTMTELDGGVVRRHRVLAHHQAHGMWLEWLREN